MKIKRIDSYNDPRFSEKVLKQHGAFEAEGLLYEIEIISGTEAIVHGPAGYAREVIEDFRYYAEHILLFYNDEKERIAEYPPLEIFDIGIDQIQPSQFYVDIDKKRALSDIISGPGDIIIPVIRQKERFVSLDGHTRLSLAIDRGYKTVSAFISDGGDWIHRFVDEAIKRGIKTPCDMRVLSHEEYLIRWTRFCDEMFPQEPHGRLRSRDTRV